MCISLGRLFNHKEHKEKSTKGTENIFDQWDFLSVRCEKLRAFCGYVFQINPYEKPHRGE